jgi:hypothetical protein
MILPAVCSNTYPTRIQLSALNRAYVELHRCGVVHLDAGIRNLCLTPAKELRLQFVILDFTLARSISHTIACILDWSGAEGAHLDQLYEELEYETVMQWLGTTVNGQLHSNMCAMSPDELAIHDPRVIQIQM